MTIKIRERRDGRKGARQAIFYALKPGAVKPERIRINVPEHITSKTGAERWAQTVQAAIQRGEPVPQLREGKRAAAEAKAAKEQAEKAAAREATTVREWVDTYLADCAAQRLRPTTLDLRRYQLGLLVEVAGDRRVAEFGELDWQRLRRRVGAFVPKSANDVLAHAARCLEAAHRSGLREAVERPAKIRPNAELGEDDDAVIAGGPPAHYTVEELDRLVIAAAQVGDEHLAVLLLGCDAGLRRGEIAGLKASDIEPSGWIHVRRTIVYAAGRRQVFLPKSGKPRRVPATPRLLEVLGRLVETAVDGWLLRKRNGALALPRTVWDMACRVCRDADLPLEGPHKLRHTYATHALRAGVPLVTVQELLGHESIRTTSIYLHSDEADERETARRLAAFRAREADTAATQRGVVVELDAASRRNRK